MLSGVRDPYKVRSHSALQVYLGTMKHFCATRLRLRGEPGAWQYWSTDNVLTCILTDNKRDQSSDLRRDNVVINFLKIHLIRTDSGMVEVRSSNPGDIQARARHQSAGGAALCPGRRRPARKEQTAPSSAF